MLSFTIQFEIVITKVFIVPQRPHLRSWVNLAYSWKIAIVRDEYIRDPVVGKLTFAAFYESSGSFQ